MKRSFASAILCLAVVAMLVGTAQAVTNVQATTVGAWTFDEKTPGNTTDGWPPTLGAIIDAAGADNNGTAVGRIFTNNLGDDDQNNPANYTQIWPTYDVPSTPNGSDPSSLRFGNFANNESASYAPPLFIQGRVECPTREGYQDWDLMVGDGMDYTIECVIKPEPRPTLDEGGNENPVDRHDFWEGLVTRITLNRASGNADALYPAWYMRTNGYDNAANGFEFTSYVDAGHYFSLGNGDLNLLDGNWHHLAVVLDADGAGNVNAKLYKDNVKVAEGNYANQVNCTPSQYNNYPPPYDNCTTNALWIADFIGRWDDQYIGLMDGVAFSKAALGPGCGAAPGNFVLNRVPEPSSIVLLVMGALALLAIRRAR